MENLDIRFSKLDEDGYYDFYKFYGIDKYKEDVKDSEMSYYFKEVKKIKEVILKKFRSILDTKIYSLKNNSALINCIECLIKTFNDDSYDTFYGVNNFIVMTDSYLCFNNVVNNMDDYLFDIFDKNAISREMIVVVDRSLKEYYFIVMDVSVFVDKTKTSIYTFNICNDKVISRKVKYNSYFSFEYLDEKSLIKRIKSLK